MRINPRIALAFVVGLTMAGGSYLLSQNSKTQETKDQLVVTAEKPVREFIPVDDTDQDGLPDWQNSLALNTINLNEESQYTRTGALVTEIATLASGPEANSEKILAEIGSNLAQEAVDTMYTKEDLLVTTDNSLSALRAYGNNIAAIALDNAPPSGTEDELTVLNRALVRNDPNVLNGLSPTIISYERMVIAMLETSVPSSMVREHLSLLNVYQAILNDIKIFQAVLADALPAMIRFRRYPADAEALYVALNLLYLKLHNQGIVWSATDRASQFIVIE